MTEENIAQSEQEAPPAEQTASASTTLDVSDLSMRQLMELDACTRCGECINWCPVYSQDKREAITPRGKALALLKKLRQQHGLWAKLFGAKPVSPKEMKEFVDSCYECSVCGQCHFVCPVAIDTIELWEAIRKSLVKGGLGPLPTQQALIKSVISYDNPWQQPRSARAKWARALRKEVTIKELGKEKAETLFFVGCTASFDVNIQAVALNAARIFGKLGMDFGILGKDERCCGSVLLRMGHPEFKRLASENIDLFNSLCVKRIITSCSGCYKTISQDYPTVGKVNAEVYHIAKFLSKMIDEKKLVFKKPINRTVTYHDPCHLGRHVRIFDEPRKVLAAIPGLKVVEMERTREYSRCCGAGGGLKAGFPDVQGKISQERIQEAEKTGAEDLVSACPFCYQGLQIGIQAMGSKLKMRDITELVVEALGE